jgi:orf140a gp
MKKMNYGKSRYNAYRKRSYSRSDTQRRKYAQAMDELEQSFDDLEGWELSSMKDSAYKDFGKYEVRLSNHSADNQYHDLENGKLLVNIKASKLNFVDIIENHLQKIIEKIETLDLEQYRFINATNLENNIKCYYKGYKSKKDVIE